MTDIVIYHNPACGTSRSGVAALGRASTCDGCATATGATPPAAPKSQYLNKQQAENWFMEGLKLEENPDTVPQAVAAYQRAIELNPEAAGAYINLGTIYYNMHRLGDAEKAHQYAEETRRLKQAEREGPELPPKSMQAIRPQ